ncbi:hypothetical protein [Arthrobacter sp. Soil762]|uniref:hypothetical protein n=1 Tax=Arthrobacter sp. Soil762 TaxID=1736401 RepID=UPI000B0FBCA4|nr:hypothetical protein [Arthrobacter sp. Soil762]
MSVFSILQAAYETLSEGAAKNVRRDVMFAALSAPKSTLWTMPAALRPPPDE